MSQKQPEKKEQTDLEYLKWSIEVLTDKEDEFRTKIASIKDELTSLQEDISMIQTDRLRKGATEAYNRLVIEKKTTMEHLKAVRDDLKHVRSIYKTLREKGKKQ